MIDPILERRLKDCRELLRFWGIYQEYFEGAVRGENITPDNEKRFLELKSRIAMLHDTFMESIKDKNAANVAQSMLENVIRAITLKHVNRLEPTDVKKLQIEWHEAYLMLNETIGFLEEEQTEKGKITASQYRSQKTSKAVGRTLANIASNNSFKVVVVLGVLLLLAVGLPLMGVFNYGMLRDTPGFFQTPVYLWIEGVYRPYIDKNYAWRSVEEAIKFGRDDRKIPKDHEKLPSARPTTPANKDQAIQLLAARGNVSPATFTETVKLQNATEYKTEDWTVDRTELTVLFFLMPKTQDANEAVTNFNTWVSALPTAEAYKRQVEVVNDYNLVIVMICEQADKRSAYRNTMWKIDEVAK